MRNKLTEKNIATVLFAVTILFFTLAQRDTTKLQKMYRPAVAAHPLDIQVQSTAETVQPVQAAQDIKQ